MGKVVKLNPYFQKVNEIQDKYTVKDIKRRFSIFRWATVAFAIITAFSLYGLIQRLETIEFVLSVPPHQESIQPVTQYPEIPDIELTYLQL